ncbi:hypothetical protein HG536_0H03600 [Torulaspora globosa]|uniref:MTHFR SAM-binding regulatory domain-containing protein n=1 Tax=Torulaspora globosa TaxID=48254 RepID=A0A7G3ZN98_9SACH|nr:uncharacterized protein HG536_0H03600 [Torulaspora globosa]QLL34984.1 hypothetical protein HG536_0H03600 [Torulaspora globosa]
MKITEKLQKQREKSSKPTFSYEYFVPKTTQGVQNLYDRMDRMYESSLPQFIDITWNAGGGVLSRLSTDLVSTAQSVLGLETCMHLTCTNMPVSRIDEALQSAYDSGCQNILALRGDPPVNSEWTQVQGGFKYAKDLVKYIRAKYRDHFDIGVAGYPEGHPGDDTDDSELIDYLKQKVDAGASFVITQMFYDADIFIKWCKKVREAGIDIPIIPGIMPITTYAAFLRRAQWCDIHIPDEFMKQLEPIKDDDQQVRETGTSLVVDMCQRILDSGYVTHLHLYTMNLEKAPLMILERMNLLPDQEELDGENTLAMLPWRKSLNPQRRNEEVRPIFWKRRPYSYVARTSQWAVDEFPNGRFGDSSSPAFGDLDLCGSSLIRQSGKKSLELWSTPKTAEDVAQLVVDFLERKVSCLPWSDMPLNHEVDAILDDLIQLNKKQIITINSQTQLNGVKSSDPVFGWGPKDGYVYQKQYLEFLLPRSKAQRLHDALKDDVILTYFAVDDEGNLSTNHPDGCRANSVTWGIFPGREVLQPTIVEKVSFLAWKEEFFHILKEWRLNFQNHQIGDSADLLTHLISDYVLVNIVDNDFISQDNKIFALLNTI